MHGLGEQSADPDSGVPLLSKRSLLCSRRRLDHVNNPDYSVTFRTVSLTDRWQSGISQALALQPQWFRVNYH